MNFGSSSARFRSPSNFMKKSNCFTFKNQTTPRMTHRFLPPVASTRNYGNSNGLKTPIVSHSALFGLPRDENYSEVEMMDQENLGIEEFFERDENIQQKGNFYGNRNNIFSYSTVDIQDDKKVSNTSINLYKGNQPLNYTNDVIKSTPLRQTILCADTPNSLGFKMDEKNRMSLRNSKENTPKPYPKWNPSDSCHKSSTSTDSKEQSFPRIFSVTVDKMLSSSKNFDCGKVIFELFGILDRIWCSQKPKVKKIQLKNHKTKNNLICSFYEIDRPLPKLIPGQWHRCILLLRYNGVLQCITIRSATVSELKYLDQLITTSSKSMAVLLKSQN